MTTSANPSAEMAFFVQLMRCSSLAEAARSLGVTPPAVSKRLAQLEARLGVTLLARTTRRIGLTPEGEAYLAQARRILADIEDVERQLSKSVGTPKGLVRVNATLGFGRIQLAPLVSRFCRRYPDVQVQLQLTVYPPPLTDDAFDVCVRFGEPPDARVVARKLADNRRLLCASPAYLARCGTPKTPAELARHACIGIHHSDEVYGTWRLRQGKREHAVKIHGPLASNDGEIAVQWALDGHGIVLRAEWDVARYLRSGRLVRVLERYETPPADIYAVYPSRHQLAGRVRTFVDFLADSFGKAAAR